MRSNPDLIHRSIRLVALAALAVTVACGGGGSDSPPSNPGITASFASNTPNPVAGDVTLQPGGGSGATIVLDVNFTDVADVFGASVNVGYDPNVLRFDGASFASSFMTAGPSGNLTLQATPSNQAAGTVRVFAGRVSPDAGVDVVGTQRLVRLTFTAQRRATNSAITIDGTSVEVCDSQPNPDLAFGANGEIAVSPTGGSVNAS